MSEPSRPQVAALLRAGAVAWAMIGISLLVWGAWRLLRPVVLVLTPVILGAVLSVLLLGPLVRRLEKVGVGRGLSALALAFGLTGLLLIGVGGMAPWAVLQLQEFSRRLPTLLLEGQRMLQTHLGGGFTTQELDVRGLLGADVGSVLGLLSTAGSLAVLLGGFVAGILTGGYLLSDRVSLTGMVRTLAPGDRRDRTVAAVAAGRRAAGDFLRVQLLLAGCVSIMTAAAAVAIGVPLWLPVSLAAGVGNLIPLVGPLVGGAVGTLIALTLGEGLADAALFAGSAILIQQIEGLLLGPRLLGRELRMRPSSVIVIITVAAAVGGVAAMAVSIPGYVALREGLRVWKDWPVQTSEQNEATGFDGSDAEEVRGD